MINIIRGTTNDLSLNIENEKGEQYTLQDGEKIIFGVKENVENSDYNIVKTLTSADVVDGICTIKLTPTDTAELAFGRYYFDIGLQTATGDYYMIVPCDEFYICKAVTQKEATQ